MKATFTKMVVVFNDTILSLHISGIRHYQKKKKKKKRIIILLKKKKKKNHRET